MYYLLNRVKDQQATQNKTSNVMVFQKRYTDRSNSSKSDLSSDGGIRTSKSSQSETNLYRERSVTPQSTHEDHVHMNTGTPSVDRNSNYMDRTPKTNQPSEMDYRGADTGYCSANRRNIHDTERRVNGPRTVETPKLNLAQFDPSKYQENVPTPSNSTHSGWSCSASIHSNENKMLSPREEALADLNPLDLRKQPSLCTVSDVSSYDGTEFSLQNTKKVLNFETESQQYSLNEKYSHELVNRDCARNNQFVEQTHFNYYGRSNSVDELEDRPRRNRNSNRSNSCDLDRDDTRAKLEQLVSSNVQQSDGASACAVKTDTVSNSRPVSEMGSPLNSQRLRSIRQRTRNAIVNIMDNGEVCLEFVKTKHKEEKVVEVFIISADGMQVGLYVYTSHALAKGC